MEQSDHTTPQVFLLMWMMSHPGSLAKQFIHSTSEIFLMQMVSKSCIDSGAALLNVNEDGVPSWSVAEQFLNVYEDGVPSWVNLLFVDGVLSWSRHQNYERERTYL